MTLSPSIEPPASAPTEPFSASSSPELSVVIPCLNEHETIAICVEKAVRAMREAGIDGEVVIGDNGSTDGSQALAIAEGARIVNAPRKGYGAALMAGIEGSRGKYVLMGDADDSYDFLETPKFLDKLREGHDLVQGCRLPAGGGTVKPGAMPFLHRWIGNPMLTWLVRTWFEAPINDVYCGMRGFKRSFYDSLDMRCTGMEFATEMIVKAGLFKRDVAEVPITLHPDGRKTREPHLRTFRDGWRTLRFFLLYSPKWLFWNPGRAMMLVGGLLFVLGLGGPLLAAREWLPFRLGPHTMLVGGLLLVVGHQCAAFALLAKTFAIESKLLRRDPRIERLHARLPLEKGALLGLLFVVIGVGLLAIPIAEWAARGLGDLEYGRTMPWVIAGVVSTLLGAQTILASWFNGVLLLPRR